MQAGRPLKLSPAQGASLAERYMQGTTLAVLATAVGTSVPTARKAIEAAGVTTGRYGRLSSSDATELAQRYGRGEMVPALAAAYCVSDATVRKALAMAGLLPPVKKRSVRVPLATLTELSREGYSPSEIAERTNMSYARRESFELGFGFGFGLGLGLGFGLGSGLGFGFGLGLGLGLGLGACAQACRGPAVLA